MLRYTNPDKILESIQLGKEKPNVREVSAGKPLISRRNREPAETADDPVEANKQMVIDYLEMIGLAPDVSEEIIEEAPEGTIKPKGREDFYKDTGLTEDPEFMTQLNRMQEKFPSLTKSELFRVIQGESAFNPQAVNKDSNAVGLFQFIPKVAAELGFTPEDILSMAPAEQLKVYEKYLDRWGYTGENSLAIMQAAPAYANASEDTVIYKRGTKAWEQNPGWRPSDGGDITVGSINDYYGRIS